MAHDSTKAATGWLKSQPDAGALAPALQTIRERLGVVIAILVAIVGAAIVYVATADRVYEARADILVIPVPADETVLRTLGLIPESSEPALDVETAAQLIDTPDVSVRAAEDLGGEWTATEVAQAVDVKPVPETNIVAVVAKASSGLAARDLANAFAAAAIEERTAELHSRINVLLPRLRRQIEDLPSGEASSELASEIARLEALSTESDPTIRFETPAVEPKDPVSPRPLLTIALAIVVGLVLGIGAALGLRALDPILRREEQLRAITTLPILARIPREPRTGNRPARPERLSMPVREAYRTLRATLTGGFADEPPPRSVLITGASPSEGKTTTAINLAAALAMAGKRVIVIDGDLRRPAVGEALGIDGGHGILSVLLEDESLENALVPVPAYGSDLRVLAANDVPPAMVELLSMPTASRLIGEAEKLADVVIVDSPPLTEVIDALPFARRVDKVLLVVRLGTSRISLIKELQELLAANDIQADGIALLGVTRHVDSSYYYSSRPNSPSRPRFLRHLVSSPTESDNR